MTLTSGDGDPPNTNPLQFSELLLTPRDSINQSWRNPFQPPVLQWPSPVLVQVPAQKAAPQWSEGSLKVKEDMPGQKVFRPRALLVLNSLLIAEERLPKLGDLDPGVPILVRLPPTTGMEARRIYWLPAFYPHPNGDSSATSA